MPMIRSLLSLAILIFGLFLAPASASAHKVIVFAYLEGNEVVTESGFPGGKPCIQCQVLVRDIASDGILVEGKSGDDGIWRFPLPPEAVKATDGLEIILNAGEGHKATWKIAPNEYMDLLGAPAPKEPEPQSSEAPKTSEAAQPSAPSAASPAPQAAVDTEALIEAMRKEIATTVSKELAPIRRELRQSREPSMAGHSRRHRLSGRTGRASEAYARGRKR